MHRYHLRLRVRIHDRNGFIFDLNTLGAQALIMSMFGLAHCIRCSELHCRTLIEAEYLAKRLLSRETLPKLYN